MLRPSRRSSPTVPETPNGPASTRSGSWRSTSSAPPRVKGMPRALLGDGGDGRVRQQVGHGGDALARHELDQQLVGAQVERDDAARLLRRLAGDRAPAARIEPTPRRQPPAPSPPAAAATLWRRLLLQPLPPILDAAERQLDARIGRNRRRIDSRTPLGSADRAGSQRARTPPRPADLVGGRGVEQPVGVERTRARSGRRTASRKAMSSWRPL